ncbi:MAG TPA: hypothetical protein VE642_04470 [Pyrinomonadaceae bacterium]|jgi:hypothetical protein|nr:hypothetical protein [Pyrinomonadaceae bacterium]
MERLCPKRAARRVNLRVTRAHALAAVVLALLAHAVCAAQERTAPQPQQQADARVTDPATILRRARFVYVSSESAFVNAQEVEDSLRKRKEFQAWGMVVTRDWSEADLAIEVTRKAFTRRFTFTVIDTRTREVVASGKMRSVLFGKKLPNKIAEQFANRVKVYRPYPTP